MARRVEAAHLAEGAPPAGPAQPARSPRYISAGACRPSASAAVLAAAAHLLLVLARQTTRCRRRLRLPRVVRRRRRRGAYDAPSTVRTHRSTGNLELLGAHGGTVAIVGLKDGATSWRAWPPRPAVPPLMAAAPAQPAARVCSRVCGYHGAAGERSGGGGGGDRAAAAAATDAKAAAQVEDAPPICATSMATVAQLRGQGGLPEACTPRRRGGARTGCCSPRPDPPLCRLHRRVRSRWRRGDGRGGRSKRLTDASAGRRRGQGATMSDAQSIGRAAVALRRCAVLVETAEQDLRE